MRTKPKYLDSKQSYCHFFDHKFHVDSDGQTAWAMARTILFLKSGGIRSYSHLALDGRPLRTLVMCILYPDWGFSLLFPSCKGNARVNSQRRGMARIFPTLVVICVPLFALFYVLFVFNPLNAELNPICHLLALLGAHQFLRVSRLRVKCVLYYCHRLSTRLQLTNIYG